MKRARQVSPLSSRANESAGSSSIAPERQAGRSSRVPKVSRKVHACTECQTRKIKCDLEQGKPECSRCQKKGLRCFVNKSLQSILQDESSWKTDLQQDSDQLRAAVSYILRSLNLPSLNTFATIQGSPRTDRDPSAGPSNAQVVERLSEQRSPNEERRKSHQAQMAMTRENSQEADDGNKPSSGSIVAAPMGTLYEVTGLRNIRSNPRGRQSDNSASPMENDFIARGEIDLVEAQELFGVFNSSLNHYLWGGIALVHDSLESVRRSSSLLLTAVLTVTALHIPGKACIFDVCYAEFLEIVCSSMFERYHALDDIRGLCIGAFWLSDVSWKLSGHCVRIATEMNLHQSFARAINGSQQHVEGARLWYLLYVCDHHFSIAYGRPPVIHDDASIVGHERFLRIPGITDADMRLHSQIAVFIILTKIYHTFGPDVEQVVSDFDLMLLRGFNTDLDNWRAAWEPQLLPNAYISSYPGKGVVLHYNFAKLQLNALVLRGIQPPSSQSISTERRAYAQIAVSCAVMILQLVTREPEIKEAVVGVPLYLHTMITYAAVFLLKVQLRWKDLLLDTADTSIHDLVEQVILVLRNAKASDRHLSFHIADGLKRMLEKSRLADTRQQRLDHVRPHVHFSPGGTDTHPAINQPEAPGFASFNSQYISIEPELSSHNGYLAIDLFDENLFPIGFLNGTNGQLGGPLG